MKPANGFHPWQGTIETGRLARRLVDLPPVEKLRLAARQDLRDRHERHTEAVLKRSSGPTTQRGLHASLKVDNYVHGEDAALDSWVLLVRKEDEASASDA